MLNQNISRLEFELEMLPDLRLCLPEQTFDRRLAFHGGKRSAELVAAGPAHTRGDCYLLLPQERIAFIGDLGFFECQPFMPYSNPEGWLQQLEVLIALDFDTYVPGHGPVGKVTDLAWLREYILLLIERVQSGIESGKRVDEIAAQALPAPFQSWTRRSTRLERNVAYLYELYSQQLTPTLPEANTD
jgi:glyoxylase-like metal-dependent hydrolase (beta-lactamase superfamily II)